MPGIEQKYERIIKYLKGLLSNRERYDLEKEMMQDAFEEEAFDGLTRISADELETDMGFLGNRLKDRTEPERKRSLGMFYRIAAGIILLVGIAGVLYLVFRMPSQSLITEETGKEVRKSPPEIRIPPVTDTTFSEAAVPAKAESEIPSEAATEFPVKVKSEGKCIPVQIPPVMIKPPVQKEKEPAAARVSETETIRIPEEIAVQDAAEEKTFVPVEMNAKDMAGKEISMTEDLMALDELVVVGYGVQKKSEVNGAVTVLSVEDISPASGAEVSAFVNPVPPGGSLKTFKQWVDERLDDSIVSAFPEKQKILVTITVQTDGSVSDIHMKETLPEPLAEEFRRIIIQSPRWKPAMKDDMPVVAKVAIRFVIAAE